MIKNEAGKRKYRWTKAVCLLAGAVCFSSFSGTFSGAFLRTFSEVFAETCAGEAGNTDSFMKTAGVLEPGIVWAAQSEPSAALTVTGLTWDESDGTARWDKNESARYYEVRLYRNGSSVGSTHTTKDLYYEFEENITRKGDYHFEVRATGQGTEKGPWASSYEWYVTSSEAEDLGGSYWGSGSGTQDIYHGPGVHGGGYYGVYDNYGNYYGNYNGNYNGSYGGNYNGSPVVGPGVSSNSGSGVSGAGSPGSSGGAAAGGFAGGPGIVTAGGNHWCMDAYGWWYQYANNTWPRSCWQCIDGSWYCFDDNGYRRYGWIYWNDKWYYCGTDGALMANTKTPDGYYVGSDGVWVP